MKRKEADTILFGNRTDGGRGNTAAFLLDELSDVGLDLTNKGLRQAAVRATGEDFFVSSLQKNFDNQLQEFTP